MTGQKTIVLETLNYPRADFMMIPSYIKDYRGMDIPAQVRSHPVHGEVKIFSGRRYGNNLEFLWSLWEDIGQTDSEANILKRFGIINS